jgi:uncharacterized repeat protein (TIGR01451 family)
MFEKLLSTLPYNPGLAHQMSFYGRRMHEEAIIRRTGLIFLVLTFMVQFFAVLSPPQLTSASTDTNDMIDPTGGFALSAAHPRTDAHDACVGNVRGYGSALATFGVSCASLLTANVMDVVSTSANSNGPLYSMGYDSYGATNPSSHLSTDEHAYSVAGSGKTIYSRQLHSFDTHGSSTYVHSLQVTSSTGQTVYILSTCGNIVTFGLPKIPPPPAPPAPPPAAPPATPPSTPPSTPPATPPATPPCQYNPKILSTSPECFKQCGFNKAIPATSPQCFPPCKYNASIPAGDVECKPCDASLSSQDTLACVTIRKTATNVTAGIANADGTTAQPNDIITYTLYAENKGKAAVNQYTFTEDMADVLDYADITDLHGGTMNNDKVVTWPVEKIDAAATATHQVTIKVKDPVPSTPVDPANSMRFDLTMTNVYGNAVNIKVPSPPVKTIQTTAASLPNTGPGTSLFIAASVVMVAGYFYGRARLLARESELAVKETI